METHGKKIRLAAIFEPGREIRPVWFELNRRKHSIKETTFTWQDRRGDTTLLHFTVSDGEALYELVFTPRDQSWTLRDVQAL